MIVDGWTLIVAQGPPLDNQHQWDRWRARQAGEPLPEDVRITVGHGEHGSWNEYWVRGPLPLSDASEVLVVDGVDYDPKHRKSNTVLGRCRDKEQIAELLEHLATSLGERPSP